MLNLQSGQNETLKVKANLYFLFDGNVGICIAFVYTRPSQEEMDMIAEGKNMRISLCTIPKTKSYRRWLRHFNKKDDYVLLHYHHAAVSA